MRESVTNTSFSTEDEKLQQIKDLLKVYSKKDFEHIIGVIAPHGQDIYSIQVAAKVYKQLQNHHYDTVVIISSSHTQFLEGIFINDALVYNTSCGQIQINKRLGQLLHKQNKSFIKLQKDIFLYEHSIEQQLPFLMLTLEKGFKILPIVISGVDWDVYAKILSHALAKYYTNDTLIIASTNLAHYTNNNLTNSSNYNIVKCMDEELISKIIEGDISRFIDIACDTEELVDCRLCAPGAVATLLYLSQLIEGVTAHVIDYANLYEHIKEKHKIVGYCSIIFYMKENKLTPAQKEYLLKIARSAIEDYIKENKRPNLKEVPQDEVLTTPKGVFVTISRDNTLRGCIGYIQPIYGLYEAVAKAAVEASRDPRFVDEPITKEELPLLNIEISVLSELKEIKDINEIKIGRDGIYMTRGSYSGLLLPQVATEYNMDRVEFLEATARKAGLDKDAWQDPQTKIYIFQAEIFSERTHQIEKTH